MGAIAEGFVAYAQPLIDQTDGSPEQMNKAFGIAQLCFNLALLPDDERQKSISEMQPSLGMDDTEFADFRSSIIDPMIFRHEEMFPLMHRRPSAGPSISRSSPQSPSKMTESAAPKPQIDRYAPCPCGSGEKYKFCCGAKKR
jgi:SEC-C motif